MPFRKLFKKRIYHHIDPDEIFIDSTNLPGFDTYQFEGRIEKPIKEKTFWLVGAFFLVIVLIFLGKTWSIQITSGEKYAERSTNNRLRHTLIFSERGLIYDKNKVALSWNETGELNSYNIRRYIKDPGFSNILGYISYPKKDQAGFYYDKTTDGVTGIEKIFNSILQKENGLRIIETNSTNDIVTENTIRPPQKGDNVVLTIDSEIQKGIYRIVKEVADEAGFTGGGAVIMDVNNGEILSVVSYPEYDSETMTNSGDNKKISALLNSSSKPFLNRITQGLYTPGSIMKPYVAIGALQEKVINSTDKIISTGSISIPNPYNPDQPSIFNDWKAHGAVNVREAIANSSDVYFYVVGGGYKDIVGLGINRIEKYYRLFGFGSDVKGEMFSGISGTIPNPEWKQKIFNDNWRVGDTYFTSIGQYGLQVTPLQVVRAVSAIANRGTLINPKIIAEPSQPMEATKIVGVDPWVWDTVQAGMRDTVLIGTTKSLNYPDLEIAGKTGTAELGVVKDKVNSWYVGFFPYSNPKYAFVFMLESGKSTNTMGAVTVAKRFFEWLKLYHSEYVYN